MIRRRTLVIVDVQKDFCEGGSLAVAGGNVVAERIADAITSYGRGYSGGYDHIIATKDFHLPADSNGGHISRTPDFVSTWPEHCIQGTEGAMFHEALTDVAFTEFDAVFYKGQGRPDYSGFQGITHDMFDDVHLLDWLRTRRITDLDIVGLATDYCVKATAMDAIENGFSVRIPQLLTAAVGGDEARDEVIRQVMRAQGKNAELIN